MVKALMAVPAMPKAILTMTSLVVVPFGWEDGVARWKVELGDITRLGFLGVTAALSEFRHSYFGVVKKIVRNDKQNPFCWGPLGF